MAKCKQQGCEKDRLLFELYCEDHVNDENRIVHVAKRREKKHPIADAINTVLDVIAISLIIIGVLGMLVICGYAFVFLSVITKVEWWDYAIIGVLIAFLLWRAPRVLSRIW
jgi:hypothetical protein